MRKNRKRRSSKLLGRIPLPRKRGGPQTTKKGKRGYSRKRGKEIDWDKIVTALS